MNKPSVSKTRKKLLLPFLSATIVMLVGALIFVLPSPLSTQMHETTAGQYQRVAITPEISVELDANTALTVTNSEPPRVEIIQGNTYFSGNGSAADSKRLEIVIGDVRFGDMGADFSLQTIKSGGSIAIAKGQLEMTVGEQTRLINAGQRVDFDNSKIIEESSVVGMDIASWRR